MMRGTLAGMSMALVSVGIGLVHLGATQYASPAHVGNASDVWAGVGVLLIGAWGVAVVVFER